MSDELPGYDAWLTNSPSDCDHDVDELCWECDPDGMQDYLDDRKFERMREGT